MADREDATTGVSGLWLVEDIEMLGSAFSSGSWIDATIGGVATSLDGLAFVADPVGALVQMGVSWLIEHVRPLSDALDWLAGDPDQIAAHARTWRNVAAATAASSRHLAEAVAKEVPGWTGEGATAYRSHAAAQREAMDSLAVGASLMATMTEGAGLLVALVRTMVRDLVAACVSVLVSRLPRWLAEEGLTFGFGTPVVVAQVSSPVAQWAARIARVLRALVATIRRFEPLLHRLGDILDRLREALRRLARGGPSRRGDPPRQGRPQPGPQPPRRRPRTRSVRLETPPTRPARTTSGSSMRPSAATRASRTVVGSSTGASGAMGRKFDTRPKRVAIGRSHAPPPLSRRSSGPVWGIDSASRATRGPSSSCIRVLRYRMRSRHG